MRTQPLKGLRVAACLHVTTETANLMIALRDGGADIALCASNPLSTQDDVAAALVAEYGIGTFRHQGRGQRHLLPAHGRGRRPQAAVTMDDGCDLVTLMHTKRQDALEAVIAGTEETTTGVIRLRAMAKEGVLKYPIIAVNDALTKHMFDNRYGTGQFHARRHHPLDQRAHRRLSLPLSPVSAGAAADWPRAPCGMGAEVIVTEIDPTRAIEAVHGRLPRHAHGGSRQGR